MLSVKELRFGYTLGTELYNGLSFSINPGESLVILGSNGVGKSTLLNILCGEIKNYSGSILINNKLLQDYSVKELARIFAKVSSSQVYQELSVSDYLLTGFANKMTSFQIPSESQRALAIDTLDALGVKSLANKLITQISAGEMQIVRIARALIQDPEIILLDEPTANLDVKNQIMVISLIRELSKKGYSLIVTTHNPGQAFEIGGKVLLFGTNQYYGQVRDAISCDSLKEIYESNADLLPGENRSIISFTSTDGDTHLYY